MKKRLGFVSNSSSSSFIISKFCLSRENIDIILEYDKLLEMMENFIKNDRNSEQNREFIQNELIFIKENPRETWKVEENEHYIEGYTSMDNFSMIEVLNVLMPDFNKWHRLGDF